MAKLTLSGLKTFTKNYVDAAKQAGAWNATTNNFIGLLDKIGKIVTIDQNYQDKLPELDGEDLPLGKTIEEYMIDLTLPQEYDPDGTNTMAPSYPAVEDVAYSYTLGRKTIKTSIPYDNVERGALTSEGAANMIAQIMDRLQNSYSLYKYQIKKQTLGNFINKAIAAGRVETVAKPTDTTTGEAFLKAVKKNIETASFASENTSIGGALIGSAPELVLYVNKGVLPELEVDTFAGAFNKEDLAVNCKIKVLDDFGDLGEANKDAYAVLMDPRGVKVHNDYRAIRENMNGEGDFLNVFQHDECTSWISKNTFVEVFKAE